jgi:hypothetical protein
MKGSECGLFESTVPQLTMLLLLLFRAVTQKYNIVIITAASIGIEENRENVAIRLHYFLFLSVCIPVSYTIVMAMNKERKMMVAYI